MCPMAVKNPLTSMVRSSPVLVCLVRTPSTASLPRISSTTVSVMNVILGFYAPFEHDLDALNSSRR